MNTGEKPDNGPVALSGRFEQQLVLSKGRRAVVGVEIQRRATLQLTRSILLFDEDEDLRERLRLALEREGHEVDTIDDDRDAIRGLQGRRYDLLIAHLFSRGGRRLREHLRRYPERAPVIAIVHDASLSAVGKAMSSGAWDFVPARASASEVLSVVRRALAHADLQQELRTLELSGGVMNTARYERVMRHVNAALDDVQRTKRTLRSRARARNHKASA